MHVRGLEQVVRDFHFVRNGADDVGADVAFVVKGLEAAPDAGVFVLDQFWFLRVGGVVGGGVDVDPLFYFDGAGAVVEFVGNVGGLGGDVADLADEGDLCGGGVWFSWFLLIRMGMGCGLKAPALFRHRRC